jgi:hypothetical protein
MTYIPGRALGKIARSIFVKESGPEDHITRGEFLIGTLEFAAAAFGTAMGVRHLTKEDAPSLDDLDAVADYINSNIAPVIGYESNSSLLVYYFPDFHNTSCHRRHLETIMQLNKVFGLKSVGVEGVEGIIDESAVRREAQGWVEAQKNGRYHQLAINEAKKTGKPPKAIHSLEDFLEVSPLDRLHLDRNFTSYGLDYLSTNAKLEYAKNLVKTYEGYHKTKKELKESRDLFPKIKPQLSQDELRQTLELFKGAEVQIQRYRQHMDKLQAAIGVKGQLPDYDAPDQETIPGRSIPVDKAFIPNYLPFYKAAEALRQSLLMDQRSKDSVTIARQHMLNHNQRQTALIYGHGHKDQIVTELNARDLSYIVIKNYD